MPTRICDLQRRLRREGKVRLGAKKVSARGKEYPASLESFRLTSSNRTALEHVAKMYGGEVKPWEDQFEVYTDSSEIYIRLWPTEVRQGYEYWSGGGCLRKCDGETYEKANKDGNIEFVPCLCEDLPEKERCKLTTRLDFQLAGVPSMGSWLLETHGYFAATELPLVVEHVTRTYPHGALCVLALEKRESKEVGKATKNFVVPVIRVHSGMAEGLAAIGGIDISSLIGAPAALPPSAPALPEHVDQQTGEVLSAPQTHPEAESMEWLKASLSKDDYLEVEAYAEVKGVPLPVVAENAHKNGVTNVDSIKLAITKVKSKMGAGA